MAARARRLRARPGRAMEAPTGVTKGPRVPRIDRYILSQLTGFFGFFALVLVSVYWLNRAIALFEQLIRDGQTALVVLEFTALTLPNVIALVLPVAGFAAAAYGTNRLAGESELVAMQAAGLSPGRLARPVLVFGLMVGLMVAILVHGLVPMSRARLNERQDAVAENVVGRFLRAGSFQYPARGVTIFIREVAPDGSLRDLLFHDARNPERQVTYTAEEALILRSDTGPKLVMMRGMSQEVRAPSREDGADGASGGEAGSPDWAGRLAVTRFQDLTFDIGGLIGGRKRTGTDLRDYSTPRLLAPDETLLAATRASPGEARLAAHQRLAQPLMAPVAAVLGFALLMLGGYSRFGVGRQVVIAILALIALQFASTAAENAAEADPQRWWVLYLPAAAGAVACAAVLWFASRAWRPCPARAATRDAQGGTAA